MIQRAQTIYLLLVTICSILAIFLSFSSYQITDAKIVYNACGFVLEGKSILSLPIYPFLSGIAFISLGSIFLYKKRKVQLRLNQVNYLLILVAIVLIFLDFGKIEKALGDDAKTVSYGIGMFLPVACLVFTFLANRGIKKDEKLIKSLDRLR